MDPLALQALHSHLLLHPANAPVLQWLNITQPPKLRTRAQAHHPLDEGGMIFYDTYGGALPEAVKYSLGYHNLMVNPDNGLIFAVHFGRCTFFHRCDFQQSGITNRDRLRLRDTPDGTVDIRPLGPGWAFLDCEQEAEQLTWAYALSQIEPS